MFTEGIPPGAGTRFVARTAPPCWHGEKARLSGKLVKKHGLPFMLQHGQLFVRQ